MIIRRGATGGVAPGGCIAVLRLSRWACKVRHSIGISHYGPIKAGEVTNRLNGVLVSMATGTALTYSLETLQDRDKLFLSPGDEVYEGKLAGIHSSDNDLVINPTKAKKLDNMRASGKGETIALVSPIKLALEQALEFIDDDALVEVTPKSIRPRKKYLNENDLKRYERSSKL